MNYETGAKDAHTNDFILTAMNDAEIWKRLIKWEQSLLMVWEDFKHTKFNYFDPNQLDLLFVVRYIEERIIDYRLENKETSK